MPEDLNFDEYAHDYVRRVDDEIDSLRKYRKRKFLEELESFTTPAFLLPDSRRRRVQPPSTQPMAFHRQNEGPVHSGTSVQQPNLMSSQPIQGTALGEMPTIDGTDNLWQPDCIDPYVLWVANSNSPQLMNDAADLPRGSLFPLPQLEDLPALTPDSGLGQTLVAVNGPPSTTATAAKPTVTVSTKATAGDDAKQPKTPIPNEIPDLETYGVL